jgi:hypothetical protein
MDVNINGTYTVIPKKKITLDVMVGDAHPGFSQIYLNGKKIKRGSVIGDFELGTGRDLVGKMLEIDTKVTVVHYDVYRTSVTNALKGGKQEEYFSAEKKAAKLGETIVYHAAIKFVE